MSTACTLAMVARLIGQDVQAGDHVTISQARIDQIAQRYELSASDISHAKACVRRLGIRYRIVR